MIFPKISKIIIKENSNLKFSFKLSKFNEEIFFYHSKKSIILNWIQVLKCYCISEDFHQSYYVLERLGSGHFGQVFKVENIIRKELFAAKILTKNYDFDKKKVFKLLFYLYNILEICLQRSFNFKKIAKT